MSEEIEARAVLLADISRSTLLYEALGDLAAQEAVADCLRLLTQGEESICLHRDEHSLQGQGFIGLGREVDPQSPLVIHFSCEP